ncbi:distal membrane arm assembly component 2 isoform X2 [Lycorma delicatula]
MKSSSDRIPSYVKEYLETKRRAEFSEVNENSLFNAIVRSFDSKRDGPPKRISWNADTFSLENVKRVINKKKIEYELFQQRFIPERHSQLGNEIGAAHFIVFRGGGVKFYGHNAWIRMKKGDEPDCYDKYLPKKFDPSFYIEAIDASNINLYYEGLQNLKNLAQIKWISFKNNKSFDDWHLDRVTYEFRNSLEYLDISDCLKVTYRGLTALCKLKKLSVLVVNNIAESCEFQLSCLMLQDVFPNLEIKGVKFIDINDVDSNSTKKEKESTSSL